jgi:hypothetical protein
MSMLLQRGSKFKIPGSPFETRRDAAPQGERIENSERGTAKGE